MQATIPRDALLVEGVENFDARAPVLLLVLRVSHVVALAYSARQNGVAR